MHGISASSKEAIEHAVFLMFDILAYKLLGNIPKLKNKSPYFGSTPILSLAHIFVQAMGGKEPNLVERDVLRGILSSSYGYIESLKAKTSSNVVEAVDAVVKKSKLRGERVNSEDVMSIIAEEIGKAKSHMKLIAEAETTKTRNLGSLMEITSTSDKEGIEDPTIWFQVVRDGKLCSECKRLHLMPDEITPRLWKLSQLSMTWHKRGEDHPSCNGEHPHCFTGSQVLHTDKGLFTFEELYKSQESPNVLIDYRVKNRKRTGNQFGKPIPGSSRLDLHSEQDSYFLKASSVYDTGIQDVVRITMDSGHEIEVSLGHEMWVETGNTKWEKKEAKTLKMGDKVPLVTKGESFGTDHFPLEAELMGNLLGDGSINEKSSVASWIFFGNDMPYGERLYSLFKSKYLDKSCLSNLTVLPPDKKYNVERASFKSSVLGRIFLKEYGLTKKPNRMVPSRLFKADKETVSAFLRGLYAADGCSEEHSIQISQNDLGFLKQIQLLLSMFGFVSRIYVHGEAHQKIIRYADGTEYLTNRKKTWRLFVGGSDQYSRFVDEIGFGVPFKQNRAENDKTECTGVRGYWRTAKIVGIESLGPKQTYCLTEPMTNTVTVNGIVTGQCRCSINQLPPNWGFKNGQLAFIGFGYDAYSVQQRE